MTRPLHYYADPNLERRLRCIAFLCGLFVGALAASLFFILTRT